MSDPVKQKRSFSPFVDSVPLSKQSNFDQYYLDVSYKNVYRKAGIDSDGDEFGVVEQVPIIKKKSIKEVLEVEAQSVGIEAYMSALAIRGVSGDDFFTNVDLDKVQDFTDMPTDKFEGNLYGKRAVQIFANLDPALKGEHTTIEGFLNSLSKEKIDAYIKGKVDAAFPKKEFQAGGE